MKKVLTGTAILAIIAICLAWFFYGNEPATDMPERPDLNSPVATTSSDVTVDRSAPVTNDSPADLPAPDEAPSSCAQFKLDESHPWVVDEFSRIEPVMTVGPGMSVYRGLAEDDLLSLAAQKDSGAMMVLAKRAELRAKGWPEDVAVSHLDGLIQPGTMRGAGRTTPPDEVRNAAYADAERWYYQAALHGRVIALFNVGMIRGRLSGGAAGLGWISEEDLQALENDERVAFMPSMAYGNAAFLLIPEVMQSPMMVLALEDMEMLQGNPAVVDGIVDEFRRDMADNGLVMPTIPPYQGPSLEEWRAEFCEDE